MKKIIYNSTNHLVNIPEITKEFCEDLITRIRKSREDFNNSSKSFHIMTNEVSKRISK